jgi:hypothetical protein
MSIYSSPNSVSKPVSPSKSAEKSEIIHPEVFDYMKEILDSHGTDEQEETLNMIAELITTASPVATATVDPSKLAAAVMRDHKRGVWPPTCLIPKEEEEEIVETKETSTQNPRSHDTNGNMDQSQTNVNSYHRGNHNNSYNTSQYGDSDNTKNFNGNGVVEENGIDLPNETYMRVDYYTNGQYSPAAITTAVETIFAAHPLAYSTDYAPLDLADVLANDTMALLHNTLNVSLHCRPCRHHMKGSCYRSDCQYDHVYDHVPCQHWLSATGCIKYENVMQQQDPNYQQEVCPFLHGYEAFEEQMQTLLNAMDGEEFSVETKNNSLNSLNKQENSSMSMSHIYSSLNNNHSISGNNNHGSNGNTSNSYSNNNDNNNNNNNNNATYSSQLSNHFREFHPQQSGSTELLVNESEFPSLGGDDTATAKPPSASKKPNPSWGPGINKAKLKEEDTGSSISQATLFKFGNANVGSNKSNGLQSHSDAKNRGATKNSKDGHRRITVESWIGGGSFFSLEYERHREEAARLAVNRDKYLEASNEAYLRGDDMKAKELSDQGNVSRSFPVYISIHHRYVFHSLSDGSPLKLDFHLSFYLSLSPSLCIYVNIIVIQ